jgi:hypothetical protein
MHRIVDGVGVVKWKEFGTGRRQRVCGTLGIGERRESTGLYKREATMALHRNINICIVLDPAARRSGRTSLRDTSTITLERAGIKETQADIAGAEHLSSLNLSC